ncbi:RNA-directed DNA polymerase, eukaryota [Tanacetum coccineum]
MSKIDRFLISEALLERFPDLAGTILDKAVPDHRPILLKEAKADYGNIPFRFFHSWLDCDGFDELVVNSWSMPCVGDSNPIVVMSSLGAEIGNAYSDEVEANGVVMYQQVGEITEERAVILLKRQGLSGLKWGREFTILPWSSYWGLVEDDFFKAINHFHSSEKIPLGCNSSFVTLIPKVVDPVFIKDYRPISLIGSFYKIVGKLLANRIAIKKTLIFNGNFEKRMIRCVGNYHQDVDVKMGFGRKWCAWIRGCLESSVTSILVNGSPTNEFKIRRGLRQGDPLSPFLFILAMEGLHMLISRAIHSSQLHGLQIGNGDVTASHLFYADDINLAKFRLMGVGVPIGEITEMANIIGCEASTIPFVYLGVPVGANMTRIGSWKDLIDKFKTRLSRWKVKTLSEIEAIRNQFFLGADTDENKMMWIKWNKVMASKKDEGLGIGSLYGFNRALLFKWKWRFMAYPSAFWVLVIKSLFGHHGGTQISDHGRDDFWRPDSGIN